MPLQICAYCIIVSRYIVTCVRDTEFEWGDVKPTAPVQRNHGVTRVALRGNAVAVQPPSVQRPETGGSSHAPAVSPPLRSAARSSRART